MDKEKQKVHDLGFQKLDELTSAGEKVSTELFLECLAHPYQWIRLEAIRRVSDYCRQDFIWIFAIALNDKVDYVVDEATHALAKINSDKALEVLSNAFFAGTIERPHHITNAIAKFGERGYEILLKGTKSNVPNIRYYSARYLGSTGFESAQIVLEEMMSSDNEKTTFGGLVSTAARKSLKTLEKILEKRS